MSEQEGVIKYQLIFDEQAITSEAFDLDAFNQGRSKLISAGLVGQDSQRYQGLGFGNISLRSADQRSAFFITGSQTGEKPSLEMGDIACVTRIDPRKNTLFAKGQTPPSSEAMTHGVLYQSLLSAQSVVHVHSPEIWRMADELGLASTEATIAYGTPEMAEAVKSLADNISDLSTPFVFAMKGHEDGVVAVGKTLKNCVETLLNYQEQARQRRHLGNQYE